MKVALVPRLLALLLVVLLGAYYIAAKVLDYHIGNSPFNVTLQLPRGGGIYTKAEVTYRGVGVGSVTQVKLVPNGVSLTLQLNHGTRIPSDVDAHIKQLSAVGEQYVDLVPASAQGPLLKNGTVIAASRATVPLPVGDSLRNLSGLLDSLNSQDVSTVESFLATGFGGTGGQGLREIIVNGQQLNRALLAALPATKNLIVDGVPVLQNLKDTSGQFSQYTSALNQLTAQFKASDADLRALNTTGSVSTGQLATLLANTRTNIAGVVSGLAASSVPVLQYQPQVRALFDLLPLVAQDLASVTAGGNLHSTLTLNVGSPVCTYLIPSAVPAPTTRTSTVDVNNGCATTAAGLLQRGAQSAPGPAPVGP